MKEYPKIDTMFERDPKTFKITDKLKYPFDIFEPLDTWIFTEKIDGTNIRILWDREAEEVTYKGRTDKAQIPPELEAYLINLRPHLKEKLNLLFGNSDACLYGEGYGRKIQKGGGLYNPDGVGFILFDINVDNCWANWETVVTMADILGLMRVNVFGEGSIRGAVKLIRNGITSDLGDREVEGLVLRLPMELVRNNGKRIIGKIKGKDLNHARNKIT